MNVDTGSFMKLAGDVEQMAAKIDNLTEIVKSLSAVDKVVYDAGRADEREAILGGLRSRPRRLRPRSDGRHLNAIPGGWPS